MRVESSRDGEREIESRRSFVEDGEGLENRNRRHVTGELPLKGVRP